MKYPSIGRSATQHGLLKDSWLVADALEVCIFTRGLAGTAPQGHFVASLGRARSLRSLAKPLSR